jgi:hypothetical protein
VSLIPKNTIIHALVQFRGGRTTGASLYELALEVLEDSVGVELRATNHITNEGTGGLLL